MQTLCVIRLRAAVPILAVLSLLPLVPHAHAQVAGATLSGTISDPGGAVIPGAPISIRNTATNVTRDLTTDAAGFYTAPNLLPGTYEFTVTAIGFVKQVQTTVLDVGAQKVLNIALHVGAATQEVEVTAEAPAVELASSAISGTVNATTVRELPLNGRSWTDLATLQPGVDAIQTQPSFQVGGDRGNRGFGAQLTISGARPQENNYRLDGVSLNDYGNGAPGSVLGGNMGVDAIQEFSVLTSNYSSEYGKTAGGVVNAVTRSGTNQFHGTVYEFLRNSALDARNFFDRGSVPPFRRNQFGGAVGGPIRKDRTFIFGDFEALRNSKGISFTDTVPSAAARAGNYSDCASKPCTIDPAALKYLPFFPLPNGPSVSNDLGIFSFAGQQVVSENFVTSRVDHRFSDKDSLFGTYMYDDTDYHSPDAFDVQLIGSHTKRQFVAIEGSHFFSPRLMNTIRIGYNRVDAANNQSASAIKPLATDVSLGAVPGRTAADLRISGIPEFLGGLDGLTSSHYWWNSFQAYDDSFYTRGTHSLRFGVAVERIHLNYLSRSTPTGVFTFGSLSAFLTNQPSSFASALGGFVSPRGVRQTLVGTYLQDDWHWRPYLTLNLGLRYEAVTVPTEVQGKFVNLLNITDPVPHCGVLVDGCAGIAPIFSNPTLRNFEPRVGFAWDPFHNGKTALRGGFGVFDVLPMTYQFNLMQSLAAPFLRLGTVSGRNLPAGSFYNTAFALLGPASLRGTYIEPAPHRSYVTQWNLNVQRELLSPNLTAMVGYVGSRGVHLPYRTEDADMVIPTRTPQGYIWPSPVGSGTPINPNFGRIAGMFYEGNSFYHALELQVIRRMSHGLQLQGAYTWSKSIDNESGTVAGDQFGNSISALDWYDLRLSRAVSDFNVGRTLVIHGTWQTPVIHSVSGPASWALNGWQLGGIYKASDGVPFTATIGSHGDVLGKNSSKTWDYPNRVPGCNPINRNFKAQNLVYINSSCFTFPSPVTLLGNSGRNTLIGPGTSVFDFSLFKNNSIKRISETFNVQFRAEIFNLFNHPNFAVPVLPDNTDIFDQKGSPTGVAGLLTSTSTTAREIQFALKFIW